MKKILDSYKTTLTGFSVIAVAGYALFEGKISGEVFSAICALAIGQILSKDYNAK